jgi:hypothetical protein
MTSELKTRRDAVRPRAARYSHPVRAYEDEEGVRLLSEMARRRGATVAAFLRQLVREEARRMNLLRDDWSAAAEQMRDYYANDPDVKAWDAVQDGIENFDDAESLLRQPEP